MSRGHSGREQEAKRAAEFVQRRLMEARHPTIRDTRPWVGLVLGTGWGDAFTLHDSVNIPFGDIPGFEALGELAGHKRVLEVGYIDAERTTPPVAVLRGRVHMNEDPRDPAVPKMVRLQIAMLCELNVKKLVLTCAAGSLVEMFAVGDLVFMQSFVMSGGHEEMPLWGGEFVSPEDALAIEWRVLACEAAERAELVLHSTGNHAYVRGPHFEGRTHDKGNLRKLGATTVGMSVKPECCVAALYGARAMGIAFITNDAVESHDHETNVARAKASSAKLGAFLEHVVTSLPQA